MACEDSLPLTIELEEGWVEIDGVKVHFVAAGSGSATVLLHGQGESSWTWQRVMPALARTSRVYALDFPGAGKSDKLPSVNTPPSFYSNILAGFLDEMAIERVTLIGNSHGGLIALRVALAAQDRVKAICLVDSAALGRETHPVLAVLALPLIGEAFSAWCSTPWGAAQWVWTLATLSFRRPHLIPVAWFTHAARMARIPGHMMGAVIAPIRGQMGLQGQREVFLDVLPQLDVPTLIIWGENDGLVPVRHGVSAVQELPNGRLVLIPDCGHMPQVEQPVAFVTALSAFLESLSP